MLTILYFIGVIIAGIILYKDYEKVKPENRTSDSETIAIFLLMAATSWGYVLFIWLTKGDE